MAVQRICPHCGTANELDVTYCGACATQIASTSTALVPLQKKGLLPVLSQTEKATLGGVAFGLAAMAVRVGVALLKQATSATPEPAAPLAPAPKRDGEPDIRIRRRWMVNDGFNPPRWGEEEIEVHRRPDDPSSVRISFK